jgi:hypothetical protein
VHTCHFSLWTLLVVALAAAPPASRAQTLPPPPTGPVEDPAETARIRLGPLFVQPNFSLRNVGRDNNVFQEPADPKSDWTATVTMGTLAGLRYGPARLTVTTATDYVYFAEYRSERSIDGATRAQFELRSDRLRPWVAMERVKTHERAGFEIDERAGRELPSYEAGVEFRPGFRLGLRAIGRQRKVEYFEEERFRGRSLGEALDATYEEGALQLLYEMSPLSSFRVSGEMSRARFVSAVIRDADDLAVYGGVEGRRDAALEGHIDVGWRQRTPRDAAAPSFSGVVVRAAAAFVLFDQVRVAFGADRDIPWSYEEAHTFYVQQGGTATLTWRPHDRFELITTGRQYWLEYDEGLAAGAVPRTDTVYGYGGGFGFFIRGYPGTRLGMMAERAVRQSALADRRYDTPRIYTTLGFSF